MNLDDFGDADWFRARLSSSPRAGAHLARIVAVDRDRYIIGGEHGSTPAEPAGRLVHCANTAEDMPCVGDWVSVDYHDDNIDQGISAP